ncbi:MAG: hypothetical protein INR64_16820, partial [Caulobacteraceae bacterium]|nr:hypothetical protein [Caulobacter sp.]
MAGLVCWLALPDDTGVERLLGMVLLVLGVLGVLWAEGAVLVGARRTRRSRPAWRGGLWVLGGGVLYLLGALFLDAGSLQDRQRATYLANRTFLWHVSGVQGMEQAESAVWWGLRFGLAVLLLPVVMEGAARGWRGVRQGGWLLPLRQWLFWATALVLTASGAAVTAMAFGWRPVVPVAAQIGLTVGKTAAMFAVDVGSVCFCVSLTGTYLRDAARRRAKLRVQTVAVETAAAERDA